ncbi:MAG TPA: amino acid permease [Terracidiphilus sp.]|jgi:APA family basic amino acid/polyamine antiporter|nr:amino acid permease [Terracidiphilus sp.]
MDANEARPAYPVRTMEVERQTGRQLGVWAATAVVTGEAISLGIFLTPAGMARTLGSPALLAAVWCGMAVLTLAGALCFTELAVRNPQDGGEYVYLRRGFGPHIAFLYGWMAALVMYPGVAASLCVGSVPYILALVPVPIRLVPYLPAVLLIGLGALTYSGTRLSGGVMAALNWLKIPVLVALVGWALTSGHATMANLTPLTLRRAGSDPLVDAIAGATISAFFCFGGWWEAGKIAGQVRNPSRTLPIAFAGGVLVVTAIYLLVSLAFVAVVPLEQIQSNTGFVAQFGFALFGASGGRVLSACVVLCVLGGLIVLSMAVPRVTYALARGESDGEGRGILGALGRLHPRTHVPANAVLLQTCMALAVLTLGAFDRILAFIIFSAVAFLALTAASLFRAITPVKRWWYPLAPIVFIAGCGVLAAMLLLHNLIPSLLGAGIVLLGLPARALLTRGGGVARAVATESPLP